ncbi:MAG: DUF1847 domain-containing protein [Deltaproteobacteria bacterium]|nr:DUF1847 domain-containing protein [Deltaproteobacteria bacterium]
MSCAKCKVVKKICRTPEGHGPKFCPTLTKKKIIERSLEEYDKEGMKEFARQSSLQEAECYANRDRKPYIMHPTKPRIVETIEFAQKMGYKKLGVAFCGGVTHEGGILTEVLEKHGFDVVAVSCKLGGLPKERLGIKEEEKINIGNHESMCNPIAQAMVLNDAKTEFNIMFCLCVGHDAMFLKYVEAPTTIFAVKDRVTGHNPMVALYTANSYYARLKKLELGNEEEMKARLIAK